MAGRDTSFNPWPSGWLAILLQLPGAAATFHGAAGTASPTGVCDPWPARDPADQGVAVERRGEAVRLSCGRGRPSSNAAAAARRQSPSALQSFLALLKLLHTSL
jgi:hypothetical protein